MEKEFKKVFWGFILLTFHINLGAVQLVPECISYLIILSAIDKIAKEYNDKWFNICKKIVGVHVIIGIINDYFRLFGANIFEGNSYGFIYTAIMCILNLVMIFAFFEGAINLLKDYNLHENSDDFINKQKCYIMVDTIVSLMIIIVGVFFAEGSLSMLIAVVALILRIWLISCINSLSKINFTKIEI